MGKVKYEKIIAVKDTDRGNPEIRDIMYTFLEGIPHIKYRHKHSYHLVVADILCLRRLLIKIWVMSNVLTIQDYLHYKSENGYCYFYRECDYDTMAIRSKDLKILWD